MNGTCLGNEGTGPRTLHLTGRRARLPTDSAPAEWKEEWYAGIAMMIGIIGKRTKMNPPTLATADTTQIFITCSSQGQAYRQIIFRLNFSTEAP